MSPSPTGKPRVVHLINSMAVGGIQTQMVALLPKMAERYGVRVIELREEGRLAADLRARGVEVECLHQGEAPWWRRVGEVSAALARLRPALVHAHSRYPAALGTAAAAHAGVAPRLAHIYSTMSKKEWGETLKRRTEEMTRYGATLVFCSAGVEADFLQFLPDSARLPRERLPSCVDLARFRPMAPETRRQMRAARGIGEDERLIGFVGRAEASKNRSYLNESLAALRRRGAKFRVWTAGPGGAKGETKGGAGRSSAGADAANFIEHLGYVDDLAALMPLFDALVVPSLHEGMPMVVLEAWACGVAVAATDAPGLRELVGDGRDGLLAPLDAPERMAEKLEALLADAQLRERIGLAGLERSREFSVDRVAESLGAIYERAIAGARRDRPLDVLKLRVKVAMKRGR